MPQLPIKMKTSEKLVIAFDICSSTAILEDLILTDNMGNFRSLLLRIEKLLVQFSGMLNFEVYKFIGDGWILIFPIDSVDINFLEFIHELCAQYKTLSKKYLSPVLGTIPPVMGLTFGIDKGPLTEFYLNDKNEYIGRPINVACRLQGAINQNDNNPSYKALISRHTFTYLKRNIDTDFSQYHPVRARRTLKNIHGGAEFECIKMKFI